MEDSDSTAASLVRVIGTVCLRPDLLVSIPEVLTGDGGHFRDVRHCENILAKIVHASGATLHIDIYEYSSNVCSRV